MLIAWFSGILSCPVCAQVAPQSGASTTVELIRSAIAGEAKLLIVIELISLLQLDLHWNPIEASISFDPTAIAKAARLRVFYRSE